MAIINVPYEQPTIQAAVDSANLGDVILVKKGSHQESVFVNKSSIRIIAEKKHGVTLKANTPGENPFSLFETTNEIKGLSTENPMRVLFD